MSHRNNGYWVHIVSEKVLDQDDSLLTQLNQEGITWHSCNMNGGCDGFGLGETLHKLRYGLIVIGSVTTEYVNNTRINQQDPDWVVEL